jgi:ribose transport system ATP-binding protein
VAIARLLHADVDMLLLDEPTRGIDVGSKAEICRLINELAVGDPSQGRPPKAVLIVSSYLPELMGLCDRIAVMCRGRLGAARPSKSGASMKSCSRRPAQRRSSRMRATNKKTNDD